MCISLLFSALKFEIEMIFEIVTFLCTAGMDPFNRGVL